MLIQWDSDLTFGDSGAAFFGNLSGVRNYFDKPYVRQRVNYYLGKMINDYAATGPRMQTWFDLEEEASDSYRSNESTYTNWHNSRAGRARNEIGSAFNSSFNVTTGNGSSTSTSSDTISLSGTSGWESFDIQVEGHPEAVSNFTNQTSWGLSGIRLREGANQLKVQAVDASGKIVGSETFTVNFNGLTRGETYQLVVTDNSCATRITQIIGPISEELSIDENAIITTDEQCFGEGGTITLPLAAITGGSGYYSYNWTNLSTADQYITKDVPTAAAGLYEVTITDQNYGCSVTSIGIIEVDAVDLPVTVTWAQPSPITNDCFDSRDGSITITTARGSQK